MGYSRTTRPGRALMRTTRSARVMASVRSWVTYRMGTARILPEGENIVLQALPGESVQGGKGLVHHENGGSTASTRAMAARFFMAAGELPG